tara:strand:- start:1055 stop:1546 length:492 start_codon:yes stop_codon:yes gene_type:complete
MTFGLQTGYDHLYHKRTIHTSAQTTSATAGGTVVLQGSQATYTPSSSASKVVYEINFYGERTNWTHNSYFLIEHYTSGSWSEINSENVRSSINSGSAGQSNRNAYHLRWVVPAWTNAKDLRVSIGSRVSRSTDQQLTLHQITQWDGNNSSSDFADTCLIIYSA